MLVKPGLAQYEVGPEGRTFAPAANSINHSGGPSQFLDFSVHLMIWVWTPNNVQGPHFGIPGNDGIRGVNYRGPAQITFG